MITMRRRSAAVANNRTWLTICGFTALLVVAAEAEDAFRLQDIGIPSASDYQGIALGDATDEVYLYLSRDKQQGQLYQWTDGRAKPVELEELEHAGSEAGAGWADYGSDGDLDLFVSRVGLPDLLYLNEDGVFSERASSLGVDDSGSGQGVSWVDYDQDGYVDLYVARFGQPNLLYAGQAGSEPFLEQGVEVGLADSGPSTGGAWGDFDADGDLDLYVVNHKRADHLYRHSDGAFERSDLAEDDGAGVGATWVDWDNDGDLDLSLARYAEPDRLLRNDLSEGGRFTDVAPEVRLDDRGQGQMVAWGDYDLDGEPDAYVVNGGEARDVSRLYHNDHLSFSDASIETGLIDPTRGAARLGKAAIWWDHDGDGDLDLLTIARGEGTGLFENDGLSGNNGWLKVRVRNQDPGDLNWLPLKVTLHSRNDRRTNLCLIAPTSYLSQGAQGSIVGLGADRIDSVVVERASDRLVLRRQKARTTLEIARKERDLGDGHGPGSPYAVSAEEINFGEVSTGLEVSRLLYVANNGGTVLTVQSVRFLGGPPDGQSFSVAEEFPILVEPGQTDSVKVLFHCNREGTATADLLFDADHALPRVRLIGKNAGPGGVTVSPLYLSLIPGERAKLQIENQWTSAITDVRVVAPKGVGHNWQDNASLEAGAKSAFDITVGESSRRFQGRLTVKFGAPDGSIPENHVTIIIQRQPDMRGQSRAVDYGLVGGFAILMGVILFVIN